MRQATLLLAVAAILAGPATAADQRYKLPVGVDAAQAETALKSRGFNVVGTACRNAECFVVWGDAGEAKDPAPVLESLFTVEQRKLRGLAKKWQAGTITAAEKDELLGVLVARIVGIQ